jgi:hypothetical protein
MQLHCFNFPRFLSNNFWLVVYLTLVLHSEAARTPLSMLIVGCGYSEISFHFCVDCRIFCEGEWEIKNDGNTVVKPLSVNNNMAFGLAFSHNMAFGQNTAFDHNMASPWDFGLNMAFGLAFGHNMAFGQAFSHNIAFGLALAPTWPLARPLATTWPLASSRPSAMLSSISASLAALALLALLALSNTSTLSASASMALLISALLKSAFNLKSKQNNNLNATCL